jgi:hypothetical protein
LKPLIFSNEQAGMNSGVQASCGAGVQTNGRCRRYVQGFLATWLRNANLLLNQRHQLRRNALPFVAHDPSAA